MESSKYYTPTIDEFYVGFEYETSYLQDYNVWKKEILEKNEIEYFFSSYIKDASPIEFRVKYLDKKDIESLGFKEVSKKWFSINPSGKLGYWVEVILDYRWYSDNNEIRISGRRGNEMEKLFIGGIKNKSELKKLLKQLNIE